MTTEILIIDLLRRHTLTKDEVLSVYSLSKDKHVVGICPGETKEVDIIEFNTREEADQYYDETVKQHE